MKYRLKPISFSRGRSSTLIIMEDDKGETHSVSVKGCLLYLMALADKTLKVKDGWFEGEFEKKGMGGMIYLLPKSKVHLTYKCLSQWNSKYDERG